MEAVMVKRKQASRKSATKRSSAKKAKPRKQAAVSPGDPLTGDPLTGDSLRVRQRHAAGIDVHARVHLVCVPAEDAPPPPKGADAECPEPFPRKQLLPRPGAAGCAELLPQVYDELRKLAAAKLPLSKHRSTLSV
jgi:hypothetical protein